MKKKKNFLAILLASAAVAGAADKVTSGDSTFSQGTANPSLVHIQRTMKALEESTAENPAHVRVLFYGQSIVAQAWTQIVEERLTNRFPTVKFEFANLAIGGYGAESLIRTAESDLYPYYPDLLFFHDYGSLDYYEEIVRRVRERTTAEIVLWSSHLKRAESPVAMLQKRDERTKRIESVSKKLETAYVDLNRKWSEMIIGCGYTMDDLLSDGIHMKWAKSSPALKAYAGFIAGELVRFPGVVADDAAGTIREITLDDPAVTRNADGSYTLGFTGNRVVAVSDGTGAAGNTAKLRLDGRDVLDFPEMYVNTRPSAIVNWMPTIKYVGRRTGVKPIAEKWTLTYLDGTERDGQKIHYRVDGSVTGFDGEGWNTNDFVSASGRATITKNDFHVWQYTYMQRPDRIKQLKKTYANKPDLFQKSWDKSCAKVGDKIEWETVKLFADPYVAAPKGTRTVLVQGCANGPHRLEVRPQGGNVGIAMFIVYAPNSKWANSGVRE